MKKKILSLTLVVCLLAIAVVGGTLAYFTDTDNAKNEFTVGNVDIDLVEDAWDATGKAEAENVYPGEALAKDPVVKNVGENPCFVRVKVTNLNQFGDKGAITLRHGQFVPGYDTENWTLIGEYYYYNEVLTYVGDTYNTELKTETPALFNQIVMPSGLEGDETTLPIEVIVEAVQAQGAQPSWSAVKAMEPTDMVAWFTACLA